MIQILEITTELCLFGLIILNFKYQVSRRENVVAILSGNSEAITV